MGTNFLIIVVVIIAILCILILVGKARQKGVYTPFRNRIKAALRNDNRGEISADLSIMEVLVKLDFKEGTKAGLADGYISQSMVQALNSDLASLYVGTIYFAYLDKYIVDRGYAKDLHIKVDVFRNVFYRIFMETYNADVKDSPIPGVIQDVSILKLEDKVSEGMEMILNSCIPTPEARSIKSRILSGSIIEKCIGEWEKSYLPEAYGVIDNWQAETTSFRTRLEDVLNKGTYDKDANGLQLLEILLKLDFKAYAEKNNLCGKLAPTVIKRLESDLALLYGFEFYYLCLAKYREEKGYDNKKIRSSMTAAVKVFEEVFLEAYNHYDDPRMPIFLLRSSLLKEIVYTVTSTASDGTDEMERLARVLTTRLLTSENSQDFDIVQAWIKDWATSYLPSAYDFIDKMPIKSE